MITLKKIEEKHLTDLYDVIYSSEEPEWSKYNTPYFNEFKYINLETFLLKNHHEYFLSERVLGIFLNDKPIGIVTYYWESLATRWLEIGIVIYDQDIWAKGIGYAALYNWIKICFNRFPEIEHIGLTTWSGNTRMMKLAEKLVNVNLNMSKKFKIKMYILFICLLEKIFKSIRISSYFSYM